MTVYSTIPTHVWSTDEESQNLILAFCKAERITVFAEIGTCVGSTAALLAEAGIKVITCDIEDQVSPEVKLLENLKFIKGDRDDLLPELSAEISEYDKCAILIDGDHSYKALKADFKMAEKLNIPLIFLHDCFGIEDVKRWCMEQLNNPHYYVILVSTIHNNGVTNNGLAIFKRK